MKYNRELVKKFGVIYKQLEEKGDIKARQEMKKYIYSMKGYSPCNKDRMWNDIIR